MRVISSIWSNCINSRLLNNNSCGKHGVGRRLRRVPSPILLLRHPVHILFKVLKSKDSNALIHCRASARFCREALHSPTQSRSLLLLYPRFSLCPLRNLLLNHSSQRQYILMNLFCLLPFLYQCLLSLLGALSILWLKHFLHLHLQRSLIALCMRHHSKTIPSPLLRM